ncbi:hypothetical protein EDB83DRAFT_2503014 [Lactarius deliciosus]|nr:hypothetical protein EDB83DRAFT_2503014 [Lactarius deliciosus]
MDPADWEPGHPFPHFIPSSPTLSPPTSPDPLVIQEQKGKGPSIAVEIPSSGRVRDSQTDLFSMSFDSAGLPARDKDGDIPPTLPPLMFPPMTFDISPSPSILPGSGPSSYGSLCHPRLGNDGYPRSAAVIGTSTPLGVAAVLPHTSLRRWSFSNPSSLYSGFPIASSSHTRVEIGPSRGPDELSHNTPEVGMRVPVIVDAVDAGGCLTPWKREFKSRSKDKSRMGPPHSYIVFDRVGEKALTDCYSASLATRPAAEVHPHKANVRSSSDPLPFPRAFDVVSTDAADTFVIPVVVPPNLFDGRLPREIRLRIFGFLVGIYEDDHERRVREGRWTAIKASKHKWVGRDQGIRELMRMSRVCKTWSALIHDGQLWRNLDLRAFPKMPVSRLLQVVGYAGSFITSLNLSDHGNLLPSTLENLANSMSVVHGMRMAQAYNQLTNLNMSGCTTVSTPSLHYLLTQSPFLEILSLKAMPAVTNETCEILSRHCPRITSLNLSRCKNLTGAGIRSFASFTVARAKLLPLVELRMSGLKGITDSTMTTLGKAAPYLQVLDLSYCRDLHNSSLNAFVACTEEYALDSISLTGRQAGRNPNDGGRFRRRITHLRHLSLSHCILLTDIACSHLAHAAPQLELLELGGIGGELKDDGVVRLLDTLPNLRKLDLEDASDITDNVLHAITPPSIDDVGCDRVPGHALEHLIVSYANQLTNDGFLALMRNCTRLRVLEADSTRLSASSVKEFVKLSRERNACDATMVAIDCRSMNEALIKELADSIRPRLGWRSYEARRLAYLDGRDDETLGVGQDECDSRRVVLKTFASWQTVEAVATARNKRRKGWRRRDANLSGSSSIEEAIQTRSRWWSPGGRRLSGTNSPGLLETNSERDGCTIM